MFAHVASPVHMRRLLHHSLTLWGFATRPSRCCRSTVSMAAPLNGDALADSRAAHTAATAFPRSPLASSTFLPRTPHFVTGHYQRPNTFLADTEYAAALDTLTKVCNDVLLTYRGLFLIGRRRDYPMRDWWYACGGRTRPGETLCESTARLLARELSLPLSAAVLGGRMATVGYYSFVWEMRFQAPNHHGTADISVVSSIELTEDEKAVIATNTNEERQWVSDAHILSSAYHPALQRGVRDWQLWRLYAALDEAVMQGAGESAVSERAIQYVRAMQDSRRGDGSVVQSSETYLPGDEDISKQRRQAQQ